MLITLSLFAFGARAFKLIPIRQQLSPALRDLGKAAREAIGDELLERATALKYADAEVSTSKPAMEESNKFRKATNTMRGG